MAHSIVRWLTHSDPENPKLNTISGGHSIATWYVTPDEWDKTSGLSAISLILIQDNDGKVISYDNDWYNTATTSVTNSTFEEHGISSMLFSGMGKDELEDLYESFTPPFKIHLFKEEEVVSSPQASVTKNMKEYTVARSYEVEISESDLEKIKSLNIV